MPIFEGYGAFKFLQTKMIKKKKKCRITSANVLLDTLSGKFKNLHYIHVSCKIYFYNNQGPVVQSVISLTSSLRVISLTVEKM